MKGSAGRWILLTMGAAAAACCALAVAPLLRADETLAQRRARVEAMPRSEKEELERRQKRFAGLEPAEQNRLRLLHEQLEQTEDREELRRLMHRYCRWLSTLSSYERAELLEMPPEERIESVKKLLADPKRKERRSYGDSPWLERGRHFNELGFDARNRPSLEDFKAIHEWFTQYLERQMPELIARLPEPRRQQVNEAIQSAEDSARRHDRLAVVWLQGLMQNPKQLPPPDEAALADLRSRLSPEMRDRLETLSPTEQWGAMIGWFRFLMAYRAADRRPDPVLPLVEEKDLARFFEENLTSEERDRLLNLPSDEMRRELRREYLRWRLQDDSLRSPSRRGWRNRGGPPGPPHPGQPWSEERFSAPR